MLAKPVKGPLVSMLIFDPGSIVFNIEVQISSATGCLGKLTEFSAVYLQWKSIYLIFQIQALQIRTRRMLEEYLRGLRGKSRASP